MTWCQMSLTVVLGMLIASAVSQRQSPQFSFQPQPQSQPQPNQFQNNFQTQPQAAPSQPPAPAPRAQPAPAPRPQPQPQPQPQRERERGDRGDRGRDRDPEVARPQPVASSGGNFQCQDKFGFYPHHKSCDKYWACENGTATLKLCGNGLAFDDSDRYNLRENCAYPFSVDCGDRTDLEPPISTPHCPRLYGIFHDNSNCRIFYSCWNGEASKYECPPGLAYDSEQRVCVWADTVDRCDQSEVSDGFICPDVDAEQPGHYTRHAHPTDCRKFYVCIESVARPYGCSLGTVFNVETLQCDDPESVPGCEKYYGDELPEKKPKKSRAHQN